MKGIGISDRGFTLLEVMIALALVAIALTVLLGVAIRSIAVNERLQQTTRATLLAQGKLTEIKVAAADKTLAAQDGAGVFEAPYQDFQWSSAFGETPLASVKSVTVTVRWGKLEINEAVDLTSFIKD